MIRPQVKPHLARVTDKKTQKNKTPRKLQKNTLDRYFQAPKERLCCKGLQIRTDKDQEECLNPIRSPKSNVQPLTNNTRVNFRKMDNTSQENMHKVKGSPRFLLERMDICNVNKLNDDQWSKVTADHAKKEAVVHEMNGKESNNQPLVMEKQSSLCSSLLKRDSNVPNNNLTIGKSSVLQPSLNDSSDVEMVYAPQQSKCHSDRNNHDHLPLEEGITCLNKISDSRTDQLEHCANNHDFVHDKSVLPPNEKTMIPAQSFKDIVYSFCCNDFTNPHRKLSYSILPVCYDLEKCRAIHGGPLPKQVNSFQFGHVFNILDSPLSEWLFDILPAISMVVTQNQYLRGDMLRVMFHYILNGPNEDLMWEMTNILENHWSIHPSCTDHMREVYLELLERRYPSESFFKTDLTNSGVLVYIMDQMEKILNSEADTLKIDENKSVIDEDNQTSDPSKLTFEVLQERFNNYQPLFREERQEVMDTLDELACSFHMENNDSVLEKAEKLNRLTVALEVITDLLEADFMICVSTLKSFVNKGECTVKEPLIKHLMDDTFISRIVTFYVQTTNKSTWKLLSRLVGLMAETIHLFKRRGKKVWKYPNVDPDCEGFALVIFNKFSTGGWDESERLARLQSLRPSWLQQRVTLAVANSYLNLDLDSGIKAVVDIIHSHVISPLKLRKDLKKVEPDPVKLKMFSEKQGNKIKKTNKYGETLLHGLCKKNKYSVEDLACALALPETDVNAKDYYGWAPLHEAVNSMNLAKIEMLLQYRPPPGKHAVDVGVQNKDGFSPLHEAVQARRVDICHMLIQYGGICLLRKKNSDGATPLMLAEDDEIKTFFKKVILLQEEINLNSNSVLKLSDSVVRMCMLVCEAFIADHHTWEVYKVTKYKNSYNRSDTKKPCIAGCSRETLFAFKEHQHHLRKLRKILEKLGENPENSYLVRIWNDRFLYKESAN